MYLGVDIGGTKTLVAALDDNGVIIEQAKFPTPRLYEDFLQELTITLASFQTKDYKAGGIGMPVVHFDRANGIAHNFGNQAWQNVHIQRDVEAISHCPMVADNDAKLGGLSESMLVKDKYQRVLYVTLGTGIGYAFINQGVIDLNVGDGGGRNLLIEHNGKHVAWESVASGKAIVARYGKIASDIDDPAIWKTISHNLAKGMIELIALFEPEVIIIGGGVGASFKSFSKPLKAALKSYDLPLLNMPVLTEAKRPNEAVVYGCYDQAKQTFKHHATTAN